MKFTAPLLCFSSVVLALGPRLEPRLDDAVARGDKLEVRTITTTPTLPDSCTFRPTATSTATTGCPTTCSSVGICIADAAVTLPCGCARVTVQPTTVTVCPTTTACVQCQTGWGLFTVTPTTCGPAPTTSCA